jgi:exonuclease SbcC
MAVMTRERYGEVAMQGSLPTGLVRRDGPELDWERLSAGTRDLLALGLRLVMASRFLGDARGFVMMDDPLVEMDPERQQAAAAALRAFAEERQLVAFTCHPSHADLLGGNRIPL